MPLTGYAQLDRWWRMNTMCLRWLLGFVLALASAQHAMAQNANVQIDFKQRLAIASVWEKSLAEQKVYFSCSALDQTTYNFVEVNWLEMADRALKLLRKTSYPTQELEKLTTRAAPSALLPSKDALFRDVVDMCKSKGDWQNDMRFLRFTILDAELRTILGLK